VIDPLEAAVAEVAAVVPDLCEVVRADVDDSGALGRTTAA
jgi:hypothetical protein